jgi:hypothetical protein
MRRGGRARLNAPDSKSDIGVSLSGVRIPPSPPFSPSVIVIRFCYPQTLENPHKIRCLGEAVFSDLDDQDKVAAAVVILLKGRNPALGRDAFAVIFLGWWDCVFAGGFGKNGW